MPELPEVETVRRGLEPVLAGQVLRIVEIFDARLVGGDPEQAHGVEESLTGRTVTNVRRRGKYLLIDCDDGDIVAVHHLRMTGSFAVDADVSHVRMVYTLGDGRRVIYRDPRRFGTLDVGSAREVDDLLDAKLGPEPLSDAFSARSLERVLAPRSAALKAALLDQRIVAGLGNIYVDEACFTAGIRPDVPAHSVSRARLRRLVPAIKTLLETAIIAGGSTLRDYRGVEGADGTMQERFFAYGRAGKPCLRCGTTMRGLRIAGRATVFCPRCQR